MQCKHCNCELSEKEIPFFVGEDAFCPQDFVYHVVPTDPVRFGTHFNAVQCKKCHTISVDCGLPLCGQCGFRSLSVLPSK